MTSNDVKTVITTQTTETVPLVQKNIQEQNLITREPITSVITEQPVIANIIERQNVEIHHRPIIQEVHQQPIIEIERRPETTYVQQEVIENKIVQPTQYEQVGTPMTGLGQQMQQGEIITTQETNITTERQLSPIIETIIERPIYKQVIIERHEIPVQTVYTTVPVVHTMPQQDAFNFRQVSTEISAIQQQEIVQETQVQQVQQVQQQQVQQQQLQQQQQSGDRIKEIRFGYGKQAWGLSYAGDLYKMKIHPTSGILWERYLFQDGSLARFHDFSAAKAGTLFLIGLEDRALYHLDPQNRHSSGQSLRRVLTDINLPRWKSVSAYGQQHAYLLAEDGSIFNYDNGQLLRANGQLLKLSAGDPRKRLFSKANFELWGIGLDGFGKRWNGVDTWLDIGIPLRDISVGRDNSVFAIGGNGELLKWGGSSFHPCSTKVSGLREGASNIPFVAVSVFKERKGVYCVDNSGSVYVMDV